MPSELIRVEMTFEEACQMQQALEQRIETSSTALQSLADMLPATALAATLQQIAATNRALDKLQRSLHPRRPYVRAG